MLPSHFVSYELGLTGTRVQPRCRCPWSPAASRGVLHRAVSKNSFSQSRDSKGKIEEESRQFSS